MTLGSWNAWGTFPLLLRATSRLWWRSSQSADLLAAGGTILVSLQIFTVLIFLPLLRQAPDFGRVCVANSACRSFFRKDRNCKNMTNLSLLGLTVVMAITSVNSMNLFGLDSVGVNFCCAEGEKLVVRKVHKVKRAECVEGGEEEKGASLEGKQVWVGGEEDGELKTLKMLEVRTTSTLDLMLLVNAALDLNDISA